MNASIPIRCGSVRMQPKNKTVMNHLVIASFMFILCEAFLPVENIEILPPVGNGNSQYSPFVLHEDGWGSYVMYYCKNTIVENVQRDRVWRIENYENGNTTNWVNDQISVQGGSESANDDLSCSPGVVIDVSGVWHMYYVVANRYTPLTLFLYHAISTSPGTSWKKLGEVDLSSIVQPFPGYLETPTPFYINNEIHLFYIGSNGCLFVTTSQNAYNFTKPVQITSAACGSSHGRVSYDANRKLYYFLYSRPKDGESIPTEIYISVSENGFENFTNETLLFDNKSVGLDRVWSPHGFVDGDLLKVYYAGNTGDYDWWGSNTQMLLYEFSIS